MAAVNFFCYFPAFLMLDKSDLPCRHVARIWKKGWAILKEWDYRKRPWPGIFIVSTHKFWPNSVIQTLFQPKNWWYPKKKGHRQIWNGFSGQNRKFRRFFRWNRGIYFVSSAPKFLWGWLFSIFQQKSASKAPKTCNFEYFTGQWGRLEPPHPPWPCYCYHVLVLFGTN